MKDMNKIRRTVATMTNQLHKLGYSLSQVFKTAWKRVKMSITCKVFGVTYGKRQELLQFITGRKPEDLTVCLQRDKTNIYDRFAVAVVIGMKGTGRPVENTDDAVAWIIDVACQWPADLGYAQELLDIKKSPPAHPRTCA